MDSVVPYIDITGAQAYFDDVRLGADAWENSTSSDKLKALKMATVAIDRLSFKGIKVTTTQTNEFPRLPGRQLTSIVIIVPTPTIPDDIKIATCEIALTLLDGVDPELEEESLGAITEAYSTVRVTSDINVRKDHFKAGIPSSVAWKHLLPYLNDPYDIHIRKG